jgi:hypothetical protein
MSSTVNNVNLSNQFYDTYWQGGFNGSGNIKEVWGNEALTNSMIVWLSSSQGDYLRNPQMGGWLTKHLVKPMSETRRKLILNDLQSGIYSEFTPGLQNVVVTVTPNYIQKYWTITVQGYSPDVKDNINLSLDVAVLNS